MSREFYLHLNSDDIYSKVFFPKNNSSKYIFKLPHPLNLKGDSWRVGLSEISLPLYWVNVDYPDNIIQYRYRGGNDSWLSIILQPGHYKLADIFHAIKEPFTQEKNKKKLFTLKYDTRIKRVIIKSNVNNNLSFTFPQGLAKKLGFTAPSDANIRARFISLRCKRYKASYPPLLEIFRPDLFFVYTDIIQSTIVGDVYAPLLRAVHSRSDILHETQVNIFKKTHYIPLLQPYFHAIEVNIREMNGELASFGLETPTNVLLHFVSNL